MSVINGNSPSLLAQNTAYVKNGLVFYVDAGNRNSYVSGSNTVYDLSGNNHTGSLINGVAFNNLNAGSMVFDASDDYIEISSSLSSVIVTDTPGYTITGWFNASVNDNNWRTIITKESTGNNNRQYFIGLNGGYAGTAGSFSFFSNQSGTGGVSTSTTIQTDVWYYFAATHYGIDGNNANTLYVRTLSQELAIGSPFTPTTTNGGIDSDIGTSPIRIGKYTDSVPFLWNGKISNITYYNRKVSTDEILQNYNASKSRFVTSTTPVSNVPRIPTNGLVFDFDAANSESYPGSGNTWYDLSGNNNNGTLTNGPTYSSANKGSIVFDGTNDSVIVPNSSTIGITGDMTIVSWIKATNFTGERSIAGKTPSSIPAPYDFYLGVGGNPKFFRGNGSTYNNVNATNAPAVNTWQNVCVTMAGTSVVHYLNGSVNSTGTLSTTIANDPASSLYIGNRADGGVRMLGNIGVVLIYNRALSANEIKSIYNATRGRYGL